MNKLPLPGVVWLASDIHLGPLTPATQRVFHAFLDKACAEADALVLCGDIFDAWIGDDAAITAPPAWLAEALQKFEQTASAIPLWMGCGNRDFLMGSQLTRHLGAHLLPDTVCLDTDYGDVLLSHGDEYCTADKGYQRLRRLVRSKFVQKALLSLSIKRRENIAEFARKRSRASSRSKALNILDVSPDAIERAFSASGVTTMIHGHTHRPAIHHMKVQGQACTRIVLPDWDFDHAQTGRGGWAAIDRNGINLECISTPELA